jgi:pSer/pThr/pTyr-binding forkhead associated (FHA) protein
VADVEVRCARCGRVVPPGVANCPKDGMRIERTEPEPAAPAPPPPTSAPSAPEVPQPIPPPPPAAGRRLIPALTVDLLVSSPRGERPIQLDSGDTLDIGRDVGPLTDLCTDNVSGRHARVRVGDDEVVIEDVGSDGHGSTNGTYVNGSRLPANRPTPLPDGAVVTCGTKPPLTISVKVTPL